MRKILLPLLLAVFLGAASLSAGDASWSEDYKASLAKAKAADKPLLVLFTGSDWCPPCKMMDARVFESEAFADYADENLVLFKADFPRNIQQSASLKEQNRSLAESFGIQGFPTVLVLSPEGEVLDQTVGARLASPDAFLEMVRDAAKKA